MEYSIFRRINPGFAAAAKAGGPEIAAPRPDLMIPGWDFVTTVPADAEEEYSTVVPTLVDVNFSVFMVRARTGTPGVFFDSPPDSGFSVDNLAPSAPQGFSVAYNAGSNVLSWTTATEPDLNYYRIYRSTNPNFTPGPGTLVHQTTATSWHDTAPQAYQYFYKMSAVDFAGNESLFSGPGTVTDVDPDIPERFRVYQNVPNPFNPSTVLAFDVPAGGGQVKVRIFDVRGSLVRTLLDEKLSAGNKRLTWNGENDSGNRVTSGVYFYQVRIAGGASETRKMVLAK